jgi:hypothetical protein
MLRPARSRLTPSGRQRLQHQRFAEPWQDHFERGGADRAADELAASAALGKLAYPVGLHPRLLEQPAVNRELALVYVFAVG